MFIFSICINPFSNQEKEERHVTWIPVTKSWNFKCWKTHNEALAANALTKNESGNQLK